MDGYEVLTGELDAHAGKVDAFTDRMRTASDAANQVTMNDSAYGVLCQPFAAMLQPFEELGVRALRQGCDALAETARKVRDTSAGYTRADSGESNRYTVMEGEL